MKKYLWVEEYAPKTIEDCILPTELKEQFQTMVESGQLSNMLFNGDAGVGKTTVAKVLCNMLNVDMMFMNASSERGIDEVRNKIQTFASTTALYGDYKVLLLDEADNLTPDAQKALRHLIEEHQNNCRFILTANYPYKLIDPLRSRLQEYNFTYPTNSGKLGNEFVMRAAKVMHAEGMKITAEDAPIVTRIAQMYYPNWRRAMHNLQRCCAKGNLDHGLVQKFQDEHISTLFDLLKAKNFTKVREWVAESLSQGVETTDIVNLIYKEMKQYLVPASLPQAVLILADYQQKAAVVANQEINTIAMCIEIMMGVEFQ